MTTTVFRDVTVYDGTGSPAQTLDVGIEEDRFVLPPPAGAGDVIDGTGLALAPGFIDVHTHDDFACLLHPDMSFKVLGGVTTCVVGNCGMGAAPRRAAGVMARAFHPRADLPDWDGYRGYADRVRQSPASVNVGFLAGHGTIRLSSMGSDNRAPTSAEMNGMRALVREALEAGALGLSSGLVYEPGCYAETDELIALASEMKGTGALYTTHMRDEGLYLVESVEEAIAIGRAAGVGVQISHHKASGRAAWGRVSESLATIEAAQRSGLDVHADQYPYTAGSTVLSAVFKAGRFGTGSDSLEAADVVVAAAEGHAQWEGRSIAEIAAELDISADEAAGRILEAVPGTTVILHAMNEEDVQRVMRHPTTMIGSDGIPTLDGKPHPRLYGTFARVLGHYARDLSLFFMEEAVYRMTGFPAAKFGLPDRGVIRSGALADAVLFDPERIRDRGTFSDPKQTPEGIHGVWVAGQRTVADGAHTGARAGRVLARLDR